MEGAVDAYVYPQACRHFSYDATSNAEEAFGRAGSIARGWDDLD
jgi:hypothetical protein